MRPQVFVVEGKNDASRLRQIYPDIQTMTTNGSAIDLETVEVLKKFDETHDIILFLDPDHAGERIRRILSKSLVHVFHAFIDQDLAHSKNGKKIGIEHASETTIQMALKEMRRIQENTNNNVTHTFLHDVGLTGSKDSKKRRMKLAKALNIGYTNGKTLYYRLKMFDIKKEKIIEVLSESSS